MPNFLLPAFLRQFNQCEDRALRRAHVMRDEAQRLFALPLGLTDVGNVGQRGHRARELALSRVDGGAFQDQVAARPVAHFQVGAPGRSRIGRVTAAQRVGHARPRSVVGKGVFKQMRCRPADARRTNAQLLEEHDGGLVAKSNAAFLVEHQRRIGHAVEPVSQEPPQVADPRQRAPKFAHPALQRGAGIGKLHAGFVQDRRVLALQTLQLRVHIAQRGFLVTPAPERIAQRHARQRRGGREPQIGVGQ